MPAEQRFAIGVSHLLAPLFVGLIGFLADLALTAWHKLPADGSSGPRTRSTPTVTTPPPRPSFRVWLRDQFRWSNFLESFRRQLAAGTIVVGAVVGVLLLEPPSLWLYLMQILAIIFALIVVYVFGPGKGKEPSERGAVILLVLVFAGVIAFAFERARPAGFDFAAVGFKESGESPIAGFFTTTSNAVLLITLGRESDKNECPKSKILGRITAVPNDDIRRVWIGPSEVKYALADYCAQKRVALSAIVR